MTFLPIVDRELRLSARRPRTYWLRVGAGLLAAVVALGTLLPSYRGVRLPMVSGQALFWIMSAAAFGYCLLAGVFMTADSLSEEKREGTLGLLFLTALRGYDIVLGKLAATSLTAFYGLLTVFPVLAFAVMLGGVTLGEFTRVAVTLALTLFLSVCTGLCVSALSREGRRAVGGTGLVLLGLVGLFPLSAVVVPWLGWSGGLGGHLELLSPAYAYYAAFDARSANAAGRFSAALTLQFCLAGAFLLLACRMLPRAWRDEPVAGAPAKAQRWWRRFGTSADAVRAARKLMLAENPVLWFATVGRRSQAMLWTILAVVTVTALGAYAALRPRFSLAEVAGLTVLAWQLVGKLWLSWEASRRMAEDRRHGALELLLTTPLETDQIMRGWLIAIKRYSAGPILFLVTAGLFALGSGQLSVELWGLVLLSTLALVADAYTLCWVGLWRGLQARNSARAWIETVAIVMTLPWIGLFAFAAVFGLVTAAVGAFLDPLAIGCGWLALTILVDVGATGRAISSLRDDFHAAAARWSAPPEQQIRPALVLWKNLVQAALVRWLWPPARVLRRG